MIDTSAEMAQRKDECQARLEEALAELGMRYWEYDLQSKRLYRSALIRNEVGYSAYKENVPESYVEEGIIHPAYATAYLEFYHNLQKGVEGRLVFQSKYANGRWGWLDIAYKLRYDASGKPVKAVGIGGDVSKHSCITIFRLEGERFSVDYANDAFYQLTGYTKEQYNLCPEECLRTQTDAATRRQIDAAMEEALRSGKPQNLIYSLKRTDGQVRWIRRRFSVVPQPEPGVYLVPAISMDITERYGAEQQLAAERNMYQSLLDESSALMTVVDAESFQVVYANRAALEATSHLPGGYVGNVCYRCIQRREQPCAQCLLVRPDAQDSETKEVEYGGLTYRMTYKRILWNGRKALLECSEDISEQKQNMRLMEENGKQLERVITNIPTGIIVFRVRNGVYSIEQVNPAVCRMMDMDPGKALSTGNEHILMLTHPEDKATVINAARKLATPGTEVHYEFRSLVRSTNSYFWTAADGKSVLQPDGTVLVYIGYADITARREKEDEYQRRISALAEMDDPALIAKGQHNLTQDRVLLYHAKAAFAVPVQPNGSYEAAARAISQAALTVEKREELLAVTGREALLAQFAQGQMDGAVEFPRLLPDGRTGWAVVKYSLFEEPGSHDVMAFMYSYDSTERVLERKIVTKMGNMEYDLFGLIDVHTRRYTLLDQLVSASKRAATKEGDFDEAARRRILRCADPSEREETLRAMTVASVIEQLKSREIYALMYSVEEEDRRTRRKRFQFTYLDETRETIMFFRSDITEMYEKERKQLRKIERALKTAKLASNAKTDFFSRMSHDMRTPMNGILGLAELSRTENDPKVLKENIEKIWGSGQYLLGLINDTLDFQRIESGKLTLDPQVVLTRKMLDNIMDMVKGTAEAKGVALELDAGNVALDGYIRVDPLRLKQIFINLLSNAIKFTPAGGRVEFSLQTLSCEGGLSHNVLTVQDNGIGMSADFLKHRVFKPFSQENNGVTAQYAGSGLGLSIVKRLVELMGGRIDVESTPGKGTRFTIHLDLERVEKAEASTLAQSGTTHTEAVRDALQGKRVLLVEDHPLNAEIATKLLEKVGCQVDWLQNGQQAVDCFQEKAPKRYDVVLMDIRMPVMDGLEAVRRIRALQSGYAKTVPIIAMTANAYEEDVRHSAQAGMNAHLAKPIDPQQMYETIAGFLPETGGALPR